MKILVVFTGGTIGSCYNDGVILSTGEVDLKTGIFPNFISSCFSV